MKPAVRPRPRPQGQGVGDTTQQMPGPGDPPRPRTNPDQSGQRNPPRPRPRSQHNLSGPVMGQGTGGGGTPPNPARRSVDFSLLEDAGAGATSETNSTPGNNAPRTPVNSRNPSRNVENSSVGNSDRNMGNNTSGSWQRMEGFEMRRTPGSDRRRPTASQRVTVRDLEAAERDSKAPGGVSRTSRTVGGGTDRISTGNGNTTQPGNNRTSGAPQDTGNIRRYLTRPWNSTPDAENEPSAVGVVSQQQTTTFSNEPWEASSNETRPKRGRPSRGRSMTSSREPSRDPSLHQSRGSLASADDMADLVRTYSVTSSRTRASHDDDDFESLDPDEMTITAKRKFMTGSYIILFVGILLAVSGAVLTVLAFHNHFGHISIGQQWSLAGIVLMTIGICLLLTYTVTAAKNKYWARQEEIFLEGREVGGEEGGRSGNYSRNLEQSAGGYLYREGDGYHPLTQRESPSGGQYTETSSVEIEEEPRVTREPRTNNYNIRYDVAGHEVETGSGGGAAYRGRSLRPAPGAPQPEGPSPTAPQPEGPSPGSRTGAGSPPVALGAPQSGGPPSRRAPEPTRSVDPGRRPEPTGGPVRDVEPRALQPTRAAPEPPRKYHGVPDLIRAVTDGEDQNQSRSEQPRKLPNQGQNVANTQTSAKSVTNSAEQGSSQRQGQDQGKPSAEVRFTSHPKLPVQNSGVLGKSAPVPPPKLRLEDFAPRSEIVVPSHVELPPENVTGGAKRKGPIRPAPHPGTGKSNPRGQSEQQESVTQTSQNGAKGGKKSPGDSGKNGKGKDSTKGKGKQTVRSDGPSQRKPSRPAPGAPEKEVKGAKEAGEPTRKLTAQGTGNTSSPVARGNAVPSTPQQYCCVHAGQERVHCGCASGEGGSHPGGGLLGPCTGSSDEEGATPRVPSRESAYPGVPPEEGAPPKYADVAFRAPPTQDR